MMIPSSICGFGIPGVSLAREEASGRSSNKGALLIMTLVPGPPPHPKMLLEFDEEITLLDGKEAPGYYRGAVCNLLNKTILC